MFPEFDHFDLLFKNFFDSSSLFVPSNQSKYAYPVNIFKKDGKLNIEISVCGIDKKDIKIDIEDNSVLKVSYVKPDLSEEKDTEWISRCITKKSFNFGWKLSNKYDLSTIDAEMDKGLLLITIDEAKNTENKTVTIK